MTMTAKTTNVIAIKTDLEEALGYITFWRTSGEHSYDALKQCWLDAGLAEELLLERCSEKVAMRRACDQACRNLNAKNPSGTKGRKQYAVKNRRGSNVIFEYVEGEEQLGTDEIPMDAEAVAEFWVTRNEEGKGKDKTVTYEPGSRHAERFPTVMSLYDHFMDEILARDVSSWLVDVADSMKAIRLRESGGVYFIPREAAEQWDKVQNAMQAASAAVIHKIPAVDTADAVDAILDALTTEVQGELDKMQEELSTGELQGRALGTRIDRCVAIEQKLAKYAKLVGQQTVLEDQAKKMKRRATHMRMQAMEDKK